MSLIRHLVLALTLALASPAMATTWWVSPCGNDGWTGITSICTAPHGPKRTIQGALLVASNGDTINVMAGTYPGNINTLGREVHIVGVAGHAVTFVDGGGASTGFNINSGEGPDLIIESLTIRNCMGAASGGGMYIFGSSPTILGCRFSENESGTDGGGILLAGSEASISGCQFDSNVADNNGGGIAAFFSTIEIDSSDFINNQAAEGGGIYCSATTVQLDSTTFEINGAAENVTDAGGGAILAQDATVSIDDCEFTVNSSNSSASGGAIRAVASDISISSTELGGNFSGNGGAIAAVDGSTLEIETSFLELNSANSRGGSIYLTGGSEAAIISCDFTNNSADSTGGDIEARDGSQVALEDAVLTGADAGGGGSLHANDASFSIDDVWITGASAGTGAIGARGDSVLYMHDVTVSSSVVVNAGGGVALHNSAVANISRCTFGNNSAPLGGGLYTADSSLAFVHNTVFAGNEVGTGGGVYATHDSFVELINATVAYNDSNGTGGLANNGATIVAGNSIVWGNAGQEISPSVDASWCLIEGGAPGPGNIDGDPLFRGGVSDMRLDAASPAIDAGNNTLIPGITTDDREGAPRFVELPFVPNTGVVDDRDPIDLGAHEHQALGCLGDIDGDGVIGANDLIAILANWNGPGADVDGDGTTDVNDLIIVLTNWGVCI